MFGNYPRITHGNIASGGRFQSGEAKGLRKVTIIKQIEKSKNRLETKTIKCAMTDDKLEEVMDKMDAQGPGILSEFEHQGIYGDVEAFREEHPEARLDTQESESDLEGASNENSGLFDDYSGGDDKDILEKIEKLNDLYEDGVLTEEEFEEKKKELLDEI